MNQSINQRIKHFEIKLWATLKFGKEDETKTCFGFKGQENKISETV